MNNSLTFTRRGSVDTVLVLDVLEFWGDRLVKIMTSRGKIVWAMADELTIWNL